MKTIRISACLALAAISCATALGRPQQANPDLASTLSTLYVRSINPATGVNITASATDYYGHNGGSTVFGLAYPTGATTTLTAPATAGTNQFNHWALDGVAQPLHVQTLDVTLSVPHGVRTATAIYDPSPIAVRVSPTTAVGGAYVNGIVGLNGFPTAGGMTVKLKSDLPLVANPEHGGVSIPSASNEGIFRVLAYPVNVMTAVHIMAYTDTTAVLCTLIVKPPSVLKLAVLPGAINGGSNSTMYVYLDGKPASSGVTVNVGSANASLAKPAVASVLFPQGTTVKAVAITSAGVDSATPVTLNASIGGGAQVTTTLTLNPATVARVYFPNNSSVYGGLT